MNDYDALWNQLNAAAAQASHGKGAERHANGRPWVEQPIIHNARVFGLGSPLGQVSKKTEEAYNMHLRGEHDAARRELLGAIVYLAAACHVLGDVRRGPEDKA